MRRTIRILAAGLAAVMVFPAFLVAAADTFTIPAGSTLHVRLITTLSTRTNQDGDPFIGRVIEPVISNGEEIVPVGSTVEGRVTFVKEPGRVKGVAEMRLVAETITTPEEEAKYSIAASLEDAQGAEGAKVRGDEGTIKGPSSKKGDAVGVGVSAGIGAGVGAIGAGGKGSLYGAGIGAVVGLIQTLHKRGKDIILPQGTELTFVISRTTTAKRIPKPAESASQ